jgi:hypothetical protein
LEDSKLKVEKFLQKGDKGYKEFVLLKLYLKARKIRDRGQHQFSSFKLSPRQLDIILENNILFMTKRRQY